MNEMVERFPATIRVAKSAAWLAFFLVLYGAGYERGRSRGVVDGWRHGALATACAIASAPPDPGFNGYMKRCLSEGDR